MALDRLQELQLDVSKFDPEITMAIEKESKNFDIGDLVKTLQIQKKITQEKFDQYYSFYMEILKKHQKITI